MSSPSHSSIIIHTCSNTFLLPATWCERGGKGGEKGEKGGGREGEREGREEGEEGKGERMQEGGEEESHHVFIQRVIDSTDIEDVEDGVQ